MWKFLKSIFTENDVVDSFAYNLRSKVTNPFFGTLIVVWVVHNWRLFFTVFNFDDNTSLQTKTDFIAKYLDGWCFFCNLITSVGWALLVMIVSFVFLAFSKWVSGIYQDRVLPNIYRLTSKSKYKTFEEYEALDKSLNSLRAELKKEKEEKVTVEAENSTLKSKSGELEQKNNILQREKGIEAFDHIMKELNSYFSDLSEEERDLKIKILLELVEKGVIKGPINVMDLQVKGIVEGDDDDVGGFSSNRYVLTPIGQVFVLVLSKNKLYGVDEAIKKLYSSGKPIHL